MPAYPPPLRMYRSNAACWSAFSTSPVVDSQMTTSYFASSVSLNIVASSVAVTVKPFVGRELLDRLDPGRDRVVPETGGLAEDQRVEGLVAVPRMGAGRGRGQRDRQCGDQGEHEGTDQASRAGVAGSCGAPHGSDKVRAPSVPGRVPGCSALGTATALPCSALRGSYCLATSARLANAEQVVHRELVEPLEAETALGQRVRVVRCLAQLVERLAGAQRRLGELGDPRGGESPRPLQGRRGTPAPSRAGSGSCACSRVRSPRRPRGPRSAAACSRSGRSRRSPVRPTLPAVRRRSRTPRAGCPRRSAGPGRTGGRADRSGRCGTACRATAPGRCRARSSARPSARARPPG